MIAEKLFQETIKKKEEKNRNQKNQSRMSDTTNKATFTLVNIHLCMNSNNNNNNRLLEILELCNLIKEISRGWPIYEKWPLEMCTILVQKRPVDFPTKCT